jgi:WG containing repeat
MSMKHILGIVFLSSCYFQLFSQSRWAHVSIDSLGVTKTGIMNDVGKLIIPVKYDMIIGEDSFYFVRADNLWGCYTDKGKNIIPLTYQDIGCKVSEQIIRVKKKEKWGFVDMENKVVIEFKYDFACNFYEGKAYAKIGKINVYINKLGDVIRTTREDDRFCSEDMDTSVSITNQFIDSLLLVKKINGKFGVVESGTNKIIIPFEYDEIGKYFKGAILVRQRAKWGAYWDNGKLITKPKFKSIGVFWGY